MKKNIYSILLLCIIIVSSTSCKKDKTTTETPEIQISAGGYHNLVAKTDNSFFTSGFNSNGQLGDGSTINKNSFF